MVYCSGPTAADVIFSHKDFAGIHFTGSTQVFNDIWATIVKNIDKYRSYPRIVGETGGKDYIFADPTACPKEVATAIVRGAFEYQGQKCSAASRAYIPANIWPEVENYVQEDMASIKVGGVEDFTNFVNAVIDEASFVKLSNAIDAANKSEDAEVIIGGHYDMSAGYFIQPTIIQAFKPDYITMREELFGPILTVYVYDPEKVDETLDILDKSSAYALTGAIFSKNRANIEEMTERLTPRPEISTLTINQQELLLINNLSVVVVHPVLMIKRERSSIYCAGFLHKPLKKRLFRQRTICILISWKNRAFNSPYKLNVMYVQLFLLEKLILPVYGIKSFSRYMINSTDCRHGHSLFKQMANLFPVIQQHVLLSFPGGRPQTYSFGLPMSQSLFSSSSRSDYAQFLPPRQKQKLRLLLLMLLSKA